jgi:ADP-ribose pyrophosphatase YjhB (NUDIX family)
MGQSRYQATVVILRAGKVLLVRDRGRGDFSMPGGGFRPGESTVQAGLREVVQEELGGLTVEVAERLRQCDFHGDRARHKVVRLTVRGEPRIRQHREIAEVVWWDMREPLRTQGHVTRILKSMGVFYD